MFDALGTLVAFRLLGLTPDSPTGAAKVEELTAMLEAAGFRDIRIAPKDASREFTHHWAPGRGVENHIASASIEAVKPESAK